MYSRPDFRQDANIDVHVHPFVREGWNRLEDVIAQMDKSQLDIVALESYNNSLFPYVLDELERIYPCQNLVKDSYGAVLPDGKVILSAKEYNTKENFHILTVGTEFNDVTQDTPIEEIIERGIEDGALVVLDHPFVDNFTTKTAGHITEKQEEWLVGLCKKYAGDVAIEWNGYSIPWLRLGLRVPLAVMGHKTRYYDVNKHAKQLSQRLASEGYNVPLVADTDLHARSKSMLGAMGAARFVCDVEGETPKEMVGSIRDKVFKGDYLNVEGYPSSAHVLMAYCFPLILNKYFPGRCAKPRA